MRIGHIGLTVISLFLKRLFTYLFVGARERKRGREGIQRRAEGEGQAGSPLSIEPNVGLNPRISRS